MLLVEVRQLGVDLREAFFSLSPGFVDAPC